MRSIFIIARMMIKELVRKKDFYVLFILMLVMLLLFSIQNFFQIEGISRYVKDFGFSLLVFFSFIIAVTFSAKQIPQEIETCTIYPLLAKPVSRLTVVLGKFTGGVLVSAFAYTLFFCTFLVFYMTTGGEKEPVLLVESFVFGISFLCVVSAVSIFFSNFLTVSANITLSIIIYFVSTGFSDQIRNVVIFSKGIMSAVANVIFYCLPHYDFYDLRVRVTHNWDPLPLWVVGSVLLYTFIYCFMLLYLSGLIFGKKKL